MGQRKGGTKPVASKEVQRRLAVAKAALALAGHEVTAPAFLDLAHRVAAEKLTADEAISVLRREAGAVLIPAVVEYETWDDYFIPGTEVLRNKFADPKHPHGQTASDTLEALETVAATIRIVQLAAAPIAGAFNYDHMKAVHRHIFQDVFDWAGQERVAPSSFMAKSGPDVVDHEPGDPKAPVRNYAYYPAHAIRGAAEAQYAKLSAEKSLRGLSLGDFAERLAEHWGEINTIHAFREGNTRSQLVFFDQLAEQAGYEFDLPNLMVGSPLREAFVWARFYNQATAKTDRLRDVLRAALMPWGSRR
jgi:cell filamentation protein